MVVCVCVCDLFRVAHFLVSPFHSKLKGCNLVFMPWGHTVEWHWHWLRLFLPELCKYTSEFKTCAAENMVRKKKSHPDDILKFFLTWYNVWLFLLSFLLNMLWFKLAWNLVAVSQAKDMVHNFHKVRRFSDYYLTCLTIFLMVYFLSINL